MPIDPTIAEVTARLRKAEKRIDELDGMIADQSSEASAPPEGGPKEPKYRAVEPWVQYHFAPMYSRNVGNKWRWCRQWWKHAEAISRLEALWRSWEAARLNPVGMEPAEGGWNLREGRRMGALALGDAFRVEPDADGMIRTVLAAPDGTETEVWQEAEWE